MMGLIVNIQILIIQTQLCFGAQQLRHMLQGILLSLVMVLTQPSSVTVLPIEYAGHINNCSLYFQPTPSPSASLDQTFLQCNYRTCLNYYLTNCDQQQLESNQSLFHCQKMCCNPNATTATTQGTVLEWLKQCQVDYLAFSNAQMKEKNRLPFIVLAWTFGTITVVVVGILCCIYSEEWMAWVRHRLNTRNIQDNHEGMELPIIR